MMTGPNFGVLPSGDHYGRYFNLLARAFSLLIATYEMRAAGETFEAERVPGFLRRLLKDIEVLRLKYAHGLADRVLQVDLTDSGLPNFMEVVSLGTDLLRRDEVLAQLPPSAHLKKMSLDVLLQGHVEPTQFLRQLSERARFEMLREEDLFLQFALGELSLRGENQDSRQYLFTWGCYDQRKSLPFIHFMMFDQDKTETPLHIPGPSQLDFMRVVRFEGNRASNVGILALAIDDALESIHPKMIKRLRIGPLYSPLLFNGEVKLENESESSRAMRDVLSKHARDEGDFIFCFKEDIVVSERQESQRSLLNPLKGRVREVFSLPETDFECEAERATAIHRNALVPHWVLQHLDAETIASIPDLRKAKAIITFNQRGELNER